MEEPGERAVMKSKSPEFIARAIESKKRNTGGTPTDRDASLPGASGSRLCCVLQLQVPYTQVGEKKIRDAGVGFVSVFVCVYM